MKRIKLLLTVLAIFAFNAIALAQKVDVSGSVVDAKGEGLMGVTVMVQGTSQGTSTDAGGHYVLRGVPSDATLVFSSIGYAEQAIPVNGRSSMSTVTLAEDAEFLDETIVIAYGTSTKSSFTGSATMVKSDDIEKRVGTSVTSALAGATPGVQIFSSSGDPAAGGSSSIRVRGFGSMSASNSPLIILDGAPYDGSISDINPNDVESMSVLKDASAAAIYGNRGANGVIIITTKKGKAGEAQVRFDARWGSNTRLVPQYDVITDPGEYYETWYKKMYNEYYYSGHTITESYAFADAYLFDANNGGLGYQVYTVPEGQKLIGNNFKLNPNATLGYSDGEYYYLPDDWYKESFHTGFRQEYNMSVSGASDRFSYYASAGFLDDKGIIANSNYKRYTGRINAEYQAKDWMRFTTNMGYSHSASESVTSAGSWGSSGNLFYIVNSIAPIYPLYVRTPVYDANGVLTGYEMATNSQGNQLYDSNNTNQQRASVVGNAVRDNMYDSATNYADVLTGKWGVILTPIKNFTINANISLTNDNTRYNKLYSVFGSASSVDGAAYVSHGRTFAVNKQILGEYKNTFEGLHNVDILAGYEAYTNKYQSLTGYNDHLFNPFVGELNNADGSDSKDMSSYTSTYAIEGFLSRVQYDYDGRYFLSASYRRDASSRFAKGHRGGNFWSFGAAWLINKEAFFDVPWVDMLKYKLSYGEQGNDNIGSYLYTDQYTHSYSADAGYSLTLSYKGNEDLTWETNSSLNTGFDFELFGQRLNGTLDLFTRKTRDLLYAKDVPYSSGNPTGYIYTNVGSIRNTGFELSLDGVILRTKNVMWTANANFTSYKNKILSLDKSVAESGIKGSYYIREVGGSLYDGYMYKYAGVDAETGKALYYYDYEDESGNTVTGTTSVFSDATKYKIGSFLPKLYGGFGTSVNAYGFDFSIQCSYQLGGRYYDGQYQALMLSQNNAGSNIHKDILNAWTPTNTNTNVPRLDGDTQVGQNAVDRFIVSSNYLSLNNITLGYTIPTKYVNMLKLSAVRVYVAGENVALLTARKGIDPRVGVGLGSYSSTASYTNYTARRTVTAGVTLTF